MLGAHALDWRAIPAFVIFCMAVSAVYLTNDIGDMNDDRRHPRKRHRPIASGQVSGDRAGIAAIVLLAASLAASAMLPLPFTFALIGYLMLALCYCGWIKQLVMIDVTALAMLYGARVVAGAVATETILSYWMIGFCFFLFLCLALLKRTNETFHGTHHGRAYRPEDLTVLTAMTAACGFVAVLVLALYVNSPEVHTLYRYPALLWGLCAVLTWWLGRTFLLMRRGDLPDDPVMFVLTDRPSWYAAGLTTAIFIGAQ